MGKLLVALGLQHDICVRSSWSSAADPKVARRKLSGDSPLFSCSSAASGGVFVTLPLGALSSNQSPQNWIKKANKGPMKEFFLENQSGLVRTNLLFLWGSQC